MSNNYLSLPNLRFLLTEVLDAPSLKQLPRYQDYDQEAFMLALDAAKQTSDQYLFPIYREMDKDKAYYQDGIVHVHPGLKAAIKALADGGWISAPDNYEQGGQQMPMTLLNACLYIFYAANANAASHAFLTQGAANLIRSFGEERLQQAYVPRMYAGDWQGTMALTEPQAGSSLTDITTTAVPSPEGYYHIKGQKIYISGGDHTATENVVHLMLARIQGAPAGIKGVSLFVVPKYREESGQLVPNDVTTAGIYGKMGQRGYVAAHLMIGEQDDCRGYLVGEPHRGLPQMFQMMNEARIATGLMAAGTATAAYYAALQYANERPQGRHPSSKDPAQPPVLIIEHADVRRMLLFQKAVVEGSLSLLLQCSYYADLAKASEDKTIGEEAHLLLELLTPIAKSYPAEMGTLAVSAGMQVLGGAGYCDDFPLEQYYRDIRINSIYEGTTAIHGMDLLGRKVMMAEGKAAKLFFKEVQSTIKQALAVPILQPAAHQLAGAAQELHETTLHLIDLAMQKQPEVFLADATLYLEYFGTIAIGWQWLKQGLAADHASSSGNKGESPAFYRSKLAAMHYFFEYELPKTMACRQRLLSSKRVTLETPPEDIL
jgi:alkylation response protein AidB-like acyl-CoA dehydrogenase